MEKRNKKLFGTDGIRGIANQYPMTVEMAVRVGRAVALTFKGNSERSKIVIGKDTRLSGDMLMAATAAGVCSAGVDVRIAGTLPTPGVAFMTRHLKADAGIMISASHNPFYDNGIKVFDGNGFKLSDETEAGIEDKVSLDRFEAPVAGSIIRDVGRVCPLNDANDMYMDFLRHTLSDGVSFKGLKIVMDCSNGATHRIGPALFSDLGADVHTLFADPNGININDNCGSQHPETLAREVVQQGAAVGVAFDGDGDRLIAVDEKGAVLTGDQLIAVFAQAMKEKGALQHHRVVTTVMSNIGLGVALKEMDIDHVAADVGDRHVMEEMVRGGAVLGGEDSGHMIFLNHHTTGDGVLSALKLVELLVQNDDAPLSELSKVMTVFPQVLINVDVKSKPEIASIPEVAGAITSVEKILGEKGRVLVRYSGTQPVCRVMVEGPTEAETLRYCRRIADVIATVLG